MDTKELRKRSLRAEADRVCLVVGIVLAISWLFSTSSYYLTRKTGFDWFTRSGSVMVLIGAAATFRLSGLMQEKITTALKEELGSLREGVERILDPPPAYKMTAYFGYLTGIIGTLIWGYGDVLSRWVSKLLGN